ncbi:MAG: hypothetical protein GX657_06050 [Chloroflexi bacterium]|nr:hypothetical protein [Chloroflexota bacterium]
MSDGKIDIVGVGLATLDVLVRVRELPTWETMGSMSGFALDGGGPVGTGLVAAARLGARAGYVGTAGTDRTAELKMEFLTREGLDVSHVVRRPGPEGNVILVCVDEETGERTFTGLRDRHRTPLAPEELDRDYLTQAEFLHLDGHHPDAALQAARWMHAAGKQVMLDGARMTGTMGRTADYYRRLVAETDILICGSGFVPALTGRTDIWEAGRAALDLGPRIVVQTEGAEGAYTVSREGILHTPAFAVDVVDTTGAGDVFHGAYLVGLLHGWELAEVALFASAVSALKCMHLGGRAGIPTYAETLAFLAERDIPLG